MENPTPRVTPTREAQKKGLRRYESPSIVTYSGDEILEQVGPAQGYGNTQTGGTRRRRWSMD